MIRIGLLSDTHSTINQRVTDFFSGVDEIWHAGDIGNLATAEGFANLKTFRAVHGNIDGTELRQVYPKNLIFNCEAVKVFITHIGGYPGHYEKETRELISREKPALFISGHSHILKIMYDPKYQVLHINPGAAGNSGFHHVITCVRFVIDGKDIRDMEIFEKQRG